METPKCDIGLKSREKEQEKLLVVRIWRVASRSLLLYTNSLLFQTLWIDFLTMISYKPYGQAEV